MGFYIKQGEGEKSPFVFFFFFALVEVVGVYSSHGFLEHCNYGIPYCCCNKEPTTLLDFFHFF
jgi:hypothetical protein